MAVGTHAVIGRDSELRAVDGFLERVRDGSAALVFEGAPGIGKTTVWHEARRRTEERGFRVLHCRPAESETKLSFSALADLLEPLPDGALEVLPEPQHQALRVALLRASPGASRLDPRALAAGFRSLLLELARERPLVVAVDDAQWLDTSSARAIEFAFRRIAAEPIGLLLARRPGNALEQAVGGTQPVSLGPLSLASIHHLLRQELGRTLPRPLLARVHDTAEGNPFYALELARVVLESTPGPGVPMHVPRDVSQLVRRRIDTLTAPTRDVLLTAAALADPTRRQLAALHARDLDRALEEAESAGIVHAHETDVRFAHPLYAAAVYASAPYERRRREHGRLAGVVDELEERARHLALAAAGPDESVAAVLDAAATSATARGAPYRAAELSDLAVRLTPRDRVADSRRRRLACANYLLDGGDAAGCRETCEALLGELPSGPARAEVLMLLAETREDTLAANLELVEHALLDAVDDPALGARAHDLIARIRMLQGELERALEHHLAAIELAERTGKQDLLALVLGHAAHNESLLGRYTPGLLERGLRLEQRYPLLLDYGPCFAAGLRAMYADRFDEGRWRLEKVKQASSDVGDEIRYEYALLHLAELELRAGDVDRAERLAAEGLERAEQVGLWIDEGATLYVRALIAAIRGEVETTRRLAARGLERIGRQGIFFVQLESALGFLELSRGDAAAAAEHLRPLPALLDRMGYGEPSVNRVLPNAIEALVQLGEVEEARPIVDRLEERGRSLDSPWSLATGARCRALLLAADGDLDGALRSLERALAHHERAPIPLELGRTLLAKGQVERRAKRRREARESLERALAAFEELGAPLWVERAAEELRRVPIRRGAPDDLTVNEQRVAELAAAGKTNREVAQALFLSPKTVEANLSRVYRKLGIRSRAELGARMAEREGAANT